MNKKNKYRSGDIIAVDLRSHIGLWGYFQYIDLNVEFDADFGVSQLARVFDCFTEDLLNNVEDLEKKQLCNYVTFGAVFYPRLPDDWSVIGSLEVPYEAGAPRYLKWSGKLGRSNFKFQSVYELRNLTDWYVTRDDATGEKWWSGNAEYELIKHLEVSSLGTEKYLGARIHYEYLKKSGIVWEIDGAKEPNEILATVFGFDIPQYGQIPEEKREKYLGPYDEKWRDYEDPELIRRPKKSTKTKKALKLKRIDKDRFWQIIADAHAERQSQEEVLEYIGGGITELSPGEMLGFHRWVMYYLAKSYKDKLWAAAYIVMGGCSDDGFEAFRAWLIAQGREVYEAALKSPDSLLPVLKGLREREEVPELEELLSIAYASFDHVGAGTWEDWEEAAQELLDSPSLDYPDIELSWEEDDDESLRRICPLLFGEFGYNPLDS